jgi:hypothetical protein
MLVENKNRSAQRIWLARAIAIAADVVQIGVFPYVIEGALSPLDDVLDVVVAVMLIVLLGWHIAFLPSFLVKMLPFADLAPTWTVAVFIASGGKHSSSTPTDPPLPLK